MPMPITQAPSVPMPTHVRQNSVPNLAPPAPVTSQGFDQPAQSFGAAPPQQQYSSAGFTAAPAPAPPPAPAPAPPPAPAPAPWPALDMAFRFFLLLLPVVAALLDVVDVDDFLLREEDFPPEDGCRSGAGGPWL